MWRGYGDYGGVMAGEVIVVGAGPAGRALASRLIAHDVTTTVIDPHPTRTWHATYASWAEEIPSWLPSAAVSAVAASVATYCPQRSVINSPYAVFDTAALQQCLDLDGARVIRAHARQVLPDRVILDDTEISAPRVIDCRGGSSRGPQQSAYGIVVPASVADPILCGDPAVLMDWRRPAELGKDPAPSFLYAIPLGSGRVLLEETCLAGYPALPIPALRARLMLRLRAAGVDIPADDDASGGYSATGAQERVMIALAGAPRKPWRCHPLGYGAGAGLLNPTTGYSVGQSLAAADAVAEAVAGGGEPGAALWPLTARAVWDLRLRSLSVLLDLDPAQTQDFFAAFFAMSASRQRRFLHDRTDLLGMLGSMARVFAGLDSRTRLRVLRSVCRAPGSYR